ncbi:DUF6318 family protein [Pseudoglutamicibacter cumminsii]|uniref:DUF6318 family protein n=1 Tax=Pseudoglutamicibacter cumminsii TaxID=156979 RepID=UPI0021A6F49B|nr:DUF6318 family protein [Pseudoglutamicibacter cumminsii]MCT1686811.1 DUF6318 family protein [Pseudoglutamicibacter cumminsii]
MINLKRSSIVAAAVFALSAGLAGCGASGEDLASAEETPSVSQAADTAKATPTAEAEASSKASPSPSTEPTATPSPSGPYEPATSKHPARNVPAPGPLPKVAKEKSKAGRIAFVEHWLKELNYGWETGSFRDEFWEITSGDCEYCQAINRTFARMKKDKAWIVGGKIRYENLHAPNNKLDDGNFYVTLTVHEAERSYFRPGKTGAVETVPSSSADNGMLVLERDDKGWKIRGLYGAES